MPKIVDHDERRAHVVKTLYSLIAREGFSSLNMRKIASEAGYAHGAISRYFPTKQAIFQATFEEMTLRTNGRMTEAVKGLRGIEGLVAICNVLWPIGDVGRANAKVVMAFWNESFIDEELHEQQRVNNNRSRNMIREFIIQAKDDGALRSELDVETTVRKIMAQSMGWQLLAVLMPEEADDTILKQDIEALIVNLSTRGSEGEQ